MLFQNPADLAKALRPLLRNQVVIRYAAQNRGSLHFNAQLALLLSLDGRDYLAWVSIGVSVSPHTNSVDISPSFSVSDLQDHPGAIEQMCRQWSQRPFDDWMYDDQFMGAYGIFFEGQPHTSVKWDASKVHWRFLTGVVVATLKNFQLAGQLDPVVAIEGNVLMQRRFGAFAALTELDWARRELI